MMGCVGGSDSTTSTRFQQGGVLVAFGPADGVRTQSLPAMAPSMHTLAGHSRATLFSAMGVADCQVHTESPIGTGAGKSPATGACGDQQKGNLS
jgi:hypothetical protein